MKNYQQINKEDFTQKDIDEMIDLIFWLFVQGTEDMSIKRKRRIYFNNFISSYEHAQDFLIKHNIIDPKRCLCPP